MQYETLLKTDDVEVTRSERGTISFSYNDKTNAMFSLFARVAELEETIINVERQRDAALLELKDSLEAHTNPKQINR
jgi:hypothetical protein